MNRLASILQKATEQAIQPPRPHGRAVQLGECMKRQTTAANAQRAANISPAPAASTSAGLASTRNPASDRNYAAA